MLPVLVLCMGAFKACLYSIPWAGWQGTWSPNHPAYFDLASIPPIESCPTDIFLGGNSGHVFAQFYGVPKNVAGDTLTGIGTAPVAFSIFSPYDNQYHTLNAQFIAANSPDHIYHFQGLYLAPDCLGPNRCDYFAFGPNLQQPLADTYEIRSGYTAPGGVNCQNHWGADLASGHIGVPLTLWGEDLQFGHQTEGWLPHNSVDPFDPCDWRSDVCFHGGPTDGDGDCGPPTPYIGIAYPCCSCPAGYVPDGTVPPAGSAAALAVDPASLVQTNVASSAGGAFPDPRFASLHYLRGPWTFHTPRGRTVIHFQAPPDKPGRQFFGTGWYREHGKKVQLSVRVVSFDPAHGGLFETSYEDHGACTHVQFRRTAIARLDGLAAPCEANMTEGQRMKGRRGAH